MQDESASLQITDPAVLPTPLRFFIFMHRYVIPIGTTAMLLGLLVTLLLVTRLGALADLLFYLGLILFGVIIAFVSAGARAAKGLRDRELGAGQS